MAGLACMNHAGQHRTGQRQVSAQCRTRQGADQRKGRHITSTQLTGPDEHCDGQRHARQPAARQTEPFDSGQPERDGQRST